MTDEKRAIGGAKEKKDKPLEKRRQWRQAVKWAGIAAGTLWLYRWGAARALAERGYYACGGELLLLLIPLLYYMIERLAADFVRDIREFWTEDEEERE